MDSQLWTSTGVSGSESQPLTNTFSTEMRSFHIVAGAEQSVKYCQLVANTHQPIDRLLATGKTKLSWWLPLWRVQVQTQLQRHSIFDQYI